MYPEMVGLKIELSGIENRPRGEVLNLEKLRGVEGECIASASVGFDWDGDKRLATIAVVEQEKFPWNNLAFCLFPMTPEYSYLNRVLIYRKGILDDPDGEIVLGHELRQFILLMYWDKISRVDLSAREALVLWEQAAGIPDAVSRYNNFCGQTGQKENYIEKYLKNDSFDYREMNPDGDFFRNPFFLQIYVMGEILRSEGCNLVGLTNITIEELTSVSGRLFGQ